jgi:hypothetical protein
MLENAYKPKPNPKIVANALKPAFILRNVLVGSRLFWRQETSADSVLLKGYRHAVSLPDNLVVMNSWLARASAGLSVRAESGSKATSKA